MIEVHTNRGIGPAIPDDLIVHVFLSLKSILRYSLRLP